MKAVAAAAHRPLPLPGAATAGRPMSTAPATAQAPSTCRLTPPLGPLRGPEQQQMSSGRVNALLIATRQGHVVYERFYESLSEAEKAEVRGAFDQVAGASSGAAVAAADDDELVGRYRCAPGRQPGSKPFVTPWGGLVGAAAQAGAALLPPML